MKLGIVTDSTSDLPQHIIDEYEIEVVPAVLVVGGQSFVDGNGISREEYYARLPDMKQSPTTKDTYGERPNRFRPAQHSVRVP